MEIILTILLVAVVIYAFRKFRDRLPQFPGSSQRPARRNTMSRSVRNRYRTKDGLVVHEFDFVDMPNGTYRIYLLTTLDYRERSTSSSRTHRLTDGNRRYICWDAPIRSLADAKVIASEWADRTQEYIKSGTPIEQPR